MYELFLILNLIMFFTTGCVVQHAVPVLPAISTEGIRLYLSEEASLARAIEQYYQVRDLSSEEGKIDYLISRAQSSAYIFVRNGVEYSGRFSAEFIRWKLGRVREQKISSVDTAEVFIEKVASKSKMSGKPYLIRVGNQYYYFEEILKNELYYLNEFLKRTETLEQETEEAGNPDPVLVSAAEPVFADSKIENSASQASEAILSENSLSQETNS